MNEPRLVAYLDDTEPLTLAQARLQCRIDAEGSPPSHPDDDLLAAFVAVAREQVERFRAPLGQHRVILEEVTDRLDEEPAPHAIPSRRLVPSRHVAPRALEPHARRPSTCGLPTRKRASGHAGCRYSRRPSARSRSTSMQSRARAARSQRASMSVSSGRKRATHCRAACEARWGEPRVVWHGSPSRLAWELARHVVVELVGNDDRVTLHVERSDPHTGEIEDFDMWTVVGPRMIGDGAVTPLPDAVALASRWPRGTA